MTITIEPWMIMAIGILGMLSVRLSSELRAKSYPRLFAVCATLAIIGLIGQGYESGVREGQRVHQATHIDADISCVDCRMDLEEN